MAVSSSYSMHFPNDLNCLKLVILLLLHCPLPPQDCILSLSFLFVHPFSPLSSPHFSTPLPPFFPPLIFPSLSPSLNPLPSLPVSDGMITEHTGQGELTSLGRFAGALPLDLRLGTLIHYGIALGESFLLSHCYVMRCDAM